MKLSPFKVGFPIFYLCSTKDIEDRSVYDRAHNLGEMDVSEGSKVHALKTHSLKSLGYTTYFRSQCLTHTHVLQLPLYFSTFAKYYWLNKVCSMEPRISRKKSFSHRIVEEVL